ncbi:hypothetical protein LUZ60_013853 [Juncus effusus]|nr:hypothetical protein LUZ60_013853 [Juncus effusus]
MANPYRDHPLPLCRLSNERNSFPGYASGSIPPTFGAADLARNELLRPIEETALVRRVSLPGPDPLVVSNGLTGQESNILFVDGLPPDCTRREVSHLFRPFPGFKDIKVVHKEPRRTNEKGYVLCFVEFSDPKYAFAALKALQGYCFDDKKPHAPLLSIHFAKFPFRPPGSSTTVDERRGP